MSDIAAYLSEIELTQAVQKAAALRRAEEEVQRLKAEIEHLRQGRI